MGGRGSSSSNSSLNSSSNQFGSAPVGKASMYKDHRYIRAGENEFYRYGKKAVEKVENAMKPNEKGYISIPADGGKYWTFGTSSGKYGDFAKIGEDLFSVNEGGFIWAKVGTPKAEKLVNGLKNLVKAMKYKDSLRKRED